MTKVLSSSSSHYFGFKLCFESCDRGYMLYGWFSKIGFGARSDLTDYAVYFWKLEVDFGTDIGLFTNELST